MVEEQRPRALIVEDELLVLMDLEDTLRDMGFEIAGKASDLRRGLALAKEQQIDVAILDLNLAGSSSETIADELEARGVPFLFASGYTEAAIPERYRSRPRVAKPYETTSLRRVLQQVLGAKTLL